MKQNIIAKTRLSFGKVDYFHNGRRTCPVTVDLELREGEHGPVFSACGSIWNHLSTDIYCGGQCLDTIGKYVKTPKFKEVLRLWQAYHLNDMHAECEHQRALGWRELAREYIKIEKRYSWDDEKKLRGWVDFEKDERGLLGKPCPVCGYKYGHGWQYMEIPSDDLKKIKELCGLTVNA